MMTVPDTKSGTLESRDGAVISIGSELAIIGETYAARTGRSHENVVAFDDVPECRDSVIIATKADLGPSIFSAVRRTAHKECIGMITGKTARDVGRQATRYAKMLARTKSPAELRTVTLRLVDYELVANASGTVPPNTEPWQLISAGADLLSIQTHSDGIDASLGRNRVLCGRLEVRQHESSERAPQCCRSRFCHRLADEYQVVDERLIRPDFIKADVLIWNACWGLGPPVDAIDPSFSLFFQLAASPRIGAFITQAGYGLTSEPSYAALLASIGNGSFLGEALLAYNNSAHVLRSGCFMFLFGDPLMRLTPARMRV